MEAAVFLCILHALAPAVCIVAASASCLHVRMLGFSVPLTTDQPAGAQTLDPLLSKLNNFTTPSDLTSMIDNIYKVIVATRVHGCLFCWRWGHGDALVAQFLLVSLFMTSSSMQHRCSMSTTAAAFLSRKSRRASPTSR